MYVLFWNQTLRRFLLRTVASDASLRPPSTEDGWTTIDADLGGRLDALALALHYARQVGWRNYDITFENVS